MLGEIPFRSRWRAMCGHCSTYYHLAGKGRTTKAGGFILLPTYSMTTWKPLWMRKAMTAK